jgi:hypothetical protein
MNNNDTIELRSQEVKILIGQIPSIILRIGISIISLALMLILLFGYTFKYSEKIDTTILLSQQNDSIAGRIKIPVKYSSRIKAGQTVYIYFENKQSASNLCAIASIDKIFNQIFYSQADAYFEAQIKTIKVLTTNTGFDIRLTSKEFIQPAQIETQKQSFFERIF